MKHTRFGGIWVFIIAALTLVAALLPTALFAETTETAPSTDSTSSTVEITKDEDGDETYVVHDEVFVEESAAAIPGSNTVAAKLPLSLEETPLAIDSVDSVSLRQRRPTVLGDALQGVAGLNIQSGNGIFDVFSLRGLDTSANGLILVDGTREPQSAYYQLYNVEGVEVIKGPSSFLYGGAALGGAINLVRKQPRPGNFFGVGLSGGTYSTWQGTVDANYFDDDERWGARVNAQYWQSDLHRDDKEAENFGVNPAFTFRPSDRTTIHVNLEYLKTDAVPDAGIPLVVDFFTGAFSLPDVPDEQNYDPASAASDQEVYRFQVNVETRFSDRLVLRNKTYFRSFDWFSDATSLDGVFPLDPFTGGPLAVARSRQMLDDEQTVAGNQVEALWRVETGGVTHNLLFGLDVSQFTDEFTFSLSTLPFVFLDNAADVGFPFVNPIFGFGTDAESTVVAPYVVDQIHFSDKFQLLLGLRYDDIDFEDKLIGFERDDSKASPMIGAVVAPTAEFSIYVNAGESFTPQSTFVVGESREPEEGEQVEVGLRYARGDGKFRASLAAYRLDRENVAIPDQTGLPRQTGSQRNDGVELEFSSQISRGLRASFTYTWIDAELTEFSQQSFFVDPATGQIVPFVTDLSGNKAAWVPENIASLWLSQDVGDSWGFAVGGRWVDEQFIAEDNAFAIDDYFKVDAAVWFGKAPWRFQVNLDNLTDEDTFTRVFAGNSVIPAPGFTARAGFRYGVR